MLSGALFNLSGEVAINATWAEDIYFTQSGQPMDLTGLAFRMTFRACEQSGRGYPSSVSPCLTLSTDDGTLSIVDDDDGYARVLRITKAAGTIGIYGDYICDLSSEDADDVITPWAHGVVTFRNNPAIWS
jgi:hypothetical protein